MPKAYEPLPFDARNEADYNAITAKIQTALQEFEAGKLDFRTQEAFAQHVGVDKSTLHRPGRKWAIAEFDRIKKKRKDEAKISAINPPNKVTIEHKTAIENHLNRETLLVNQVKNLRRENSVLFDRVQELEEQNQSLLHIQERLQSQCDEKAVNIDQQHAQIKKLEQELRKHQGQEQGGNVVHLNPLQAEHRTGPTEGPSDEGIGK